MNFNEWWNADYDDTDNPFEKGSVAYCAYAGWWARQQQEWVSLTDQEICEAVGSPIDEVYLSDFRAIEAKLKEKNSER